MSEPARLADDVTAVILAGGFGTRLRAAVADRPKPLAWVAGRPFIGHLLEILERAGVRRAVVALCHEPEAFTACLGRAFGEVQLDYTVETTPLGTGGAVRLAAERVQTPYALVLNGDSFCEFDAAQLRAAHAAAPADAVTLVVHTPSAAARFGGVVYDAQRRITGFAEKESGTAAAGGINAGVYFARTEVWRQLEPGRAASLERELFPAWARAGRLRAFPVSGRFIDIGVPASYAEAQTFFRREVRTDFATIEELRRANPQAAAMLAPRAPGEINGWKLAVGVIVRDARGRILLERREDCGLWGLLGGRMDFGETAAQTAVRELKEETGLDITVERLVGVYSDPAAYILSYPNGDIVQPVIIVVEASVRGGEITASHESLELTYFTPDALPRLVLPSTQTPLTDCLAGERPVLR